MKKINILIIGIFALVFASCSSHKFHTTRVESKNFAEYKTYSWLTPVDSLSKDYYSNDIAKDKILSTANQELELRGLTYTNTDPDLLFRYIAIVSNKSQLVYSNFNYYGGFGWRGGPWGWGPYGGFGFGYYPGSYPVAKERIRYGHIIIEAIDRKTNSVVWQARGTSEVNNPEDAINNLPKIVQGIMNEYPVKVKK